MRFWTFSVLDILLKEANESVYLFSTKVGRVFISALKTRKGEKSDCLAAVPALHIYLTPNISFVCIVCFVCQYDGNYNSPHSF